MLPLHFQNSKGLGTKVPAHCHISDRSALYNVLPQNCVSFTDQHTTINTMVIKHFTVDTLGFNLKVHGDSVASQMYNSLPETLSSSVLSCCLPPFMFKTERGSANHFAVAAFHISLVDGFSVSWSRISTLSWFAYIYVYILWHQFLNIRPIFRRMWTTQLNKHMYNILHPFSLVITWFCFFCGWSLKSLGLSYTWVTRQPLVISQFPFKSKQGWNHCINSILQSSPT